MGAGAGLYPKCHYECDLPVSINGDERSAGDDPETSGRFLITHHTEHITMAQRETLGRAGRV